MDLHWTIQIDFLFLSHLDLILVVSILDALILMEVFILVVDPCNLDDQVVDHDFMVEVLYNLDGLEVDPYSEVVALFID